MIQGRFFKVDENSNYQNGQIVFRYLPVKWKNESKQMNEPLYPVYLVLNPYAVNFYYHGLPFDENGKKKADKDKGHAHICILHLPLSLNLAAKDNLSSRLSSFYSGSYKINKYYKQTFDYNFNSYWNLEVFKLNEECGKAQGILFLRKLILDFIFDLEHSNVFEASPNYEEIEVHLRENYFFSAISAKASYYYNRKAYNENIDNEAVSDIYAKRLAGAEIQWLNNIRSSSAVETFRYQKWFSIVEEEYNEVLFSKEFPRVKWRAQLVKNSSENYAEGNKKILRESARWYLRRYNFSKGMKSIFQFYSRRKTSVFLLAVITFFIMPLVIYSNNQSLIYNNINDKVIAYIFYIFLGIIPFIVFVSLLLYRMFLPLLSAMLPRLLMAIASAWLFFSTTEELVKSSFDVQILDINKLWVFLLIIPVIAFMSIEINNMAPDIKPKILIKRMLTLLGIGFIYSLLIGIFFTNSLTETILVRSGYLTEFYSSEVDSLDVQMSGRLYLGRDSSALKLNKRAIPYYKLSENRTNSGIYDKEKYEYLNFVKYNLTWLSLDSLRLRYDIPVLKGVPSFEVFPGMLIYRAIFALFIGIFIQLIFEDKPITEPL